MKEITEILKAVDGLADSETAILATVIEVQGSGYRLPGARMLMLSNGDAVGTVSGGCLEADVLERARRVLETGEGETFTYDTTGDENSVFSMNMGCRGVIEIRLEPVNNDNQIISEMLAAYERREVSGNIEPPIAINLFGAGADAVPLVKIASELGWQVTVHDHRPAYLTDARFPSATELALENRDQKPREFTSDSRTAAVVMTHNYERDRLILPALLHSVSFYVGVLGPKSRTKQLMAELAAAGKHFTEAEMARLYAPVGLDIGADTPEGIALAIIGEIQTVLARRGGGHLRDRQGSIYDRQ